MNREKGADVNAMQRLAEGDVVARLARRDASLFANEEEGMQSVLHRMGWIELAGASQDQVPHFKNVAEKLVSAGATDVVLLGMGGSSLASLVIAEVFGHAPGHPRLHVLDTTCPHSVSRLMDTLEPSRTFFLVSSKSGTTVEPLSLYAIFREWADSALETAEAGAHFIVITDPGSPLQELRRTDGLRLTIPTPANVGGRFSALTAFGLVPAALAGVDLDELLRRADNADRACRAPGGDNPAASLAAWIADARDAGRDKLTLAASPRYASFPLWVEQLVAESTGKGGVGVIPVPETAMRGPSGFGPDRAVVVVRASDDADTAMWAELVRAEGHPVFQVELNDVSDLGTEFVRWEYATAMLGFLLGINPFDEPDVGAAKQATMDVLGGAEVLPASDEVDGVRITYARRISAPQNSPTDLAGALAPLFSAMGPSDYMGLLAYVPEDESRFDLLQSAASDITVARGNSVCVELGPRYLHSTGQLHKGGPDEGVFLVVTTRDAEDIEIPGGPFTLAQLYRAQAEGDLATLAARGMRVMRVDLPDSAVPTIDALGQALVSTAGRL